MNLPISLEKIFWVLAVAWSIFYGYLAFEIHPESNKHIGNIIYKYTQYFVNGLGAFLGWIALYFLLKLNWDDASKFGLQHLILSYVAFVGITGNLPFVSKFFKN